MSFVQIPQFIGHAEQLGFVEITKKWPIEQVVQCRLFVHLLQLVEHAEQLVEDW